jgi:hypothetical protein
MPAALMKKNPAKIVVTLRMIMRRGIYCVLGL